MTTSPRVRVQTPFSELARRRTTPSVHSEGATRGCNCGGPSNTVSWAAGLRIIPCAASSPVRCRNCCMSMAIARCGSPCIPMAVAASQCLSNACCHAAKAWRCAALSLSCGAATAAVATAGAASVRWRGVWKRRGATLHPLSNIKKLGNKLSRAQCIKRITQYFRVAGGLRL